MKSRDVKKRKLWCLSCREKPQTMDSDYSDQETEDIKNVTKSLDDLATEEIESMGRLTCFSVIYY